MYVNDTIFGSINESLCKEFSNAMKLEGSITGELNFFLGIKSNKRGKANSLPNRNTLKSS